MWDALCILENTKRTHTFYWVNNILYLYMFCICDTEHRIGQNHHRISWNGVMTDLCIKDNFFKTKTFTHIYIHWFNVTSLSVCLPLMSAWWLITVWSLDLLHTAQLIIHCGCLNNRAMSLFFFLSHGGLSQVTDHRQPNSTISTSPSLFSQSIIS